MLGWIRVKIMHARMAPSVSPTFTSLDYPHMDRAVFQRCGIKTGT